MLEKIRFAETAFGVAHRREPHTTFADAATPSERMIAAHRASAASSFVGSRSYALQGFFTPPLEVPTHEVAILGW